jgi:hypothetical protein
LHEFAGLFLCLNSLYGDSCGHFKLYFYGKFNVFLIDYRRAAMASADNLTPKQQHFCRVVVSGQTFSESYREAYNTSNMKPATVHREAHTLMSHPKIATRVESLQRAKDRAVVASSLSDRERVLDKLRYLMDHAVPSDSIKVRACEMIGKSIGLFKDVIETKVHRTPDEILAEIDQRLAIDEESLR